MKREYNAFKTLFFKELRESFYRLIPVVFLAFALSLCAASATYGLFHRPSVGPFYEFYFDSWMLNAPVAVFLTCAILPAYAFAAERKRGGFETLKRFPTSTLTVVLAKISAILTFCAATLVFFAVSSFAIDLGLGLPATSTLLSQFLDDSGKPFTESAPHLFFCAFASLELLCWGAFWGMRIRRGALAITASVASACCVWALLGALFEPEIQRRLTEAPLFLTPFIAVGSGLVNLFYHSFYIELRALFCLVPLYGIYRQCRRQGTATAFNLPS